MYSVVDGEVAVLDRLSECDRRGTSMQVDRLGADQDERLTLLGQCLERVQQRLYERRPVAQRRQAGSLRSIQSSSALASLGLRPGPLNRSTAAWLNAATRSPPTSSERSKATSYFPLARATLAPMSALRSPNVSATFIASRTYSIASLDSA